MWKADKIVLDSLFLSLPLGPRSNIIVNIDCTSFALLQPLSYTISEKFLPRSVGEVLKGITGRLRHTPRLQSCVLTLLKRTAVPFGGQSSRTPSSLSPKRDCGPKRVITFVANVKTIGLQKY